MSVDRDDAASDGGGVLGVMSSPTGKGTYEVLCSSGDRAWVLPPQEAVWYAMAVLGVVNAAEIEAALFKILMGLGPPATAADVGAAIGHFRQSRDGRSFGAWPAESPVTMSGAVAAADGRAFVIVNVDYEPTGQLEPAEAREHAMAVLDAVHSANLDTLLHRYLSEVMLPALAELGEVVTPAAADALITHIGDARMEARQ